MRRTEGHRRRRRRPALEIPGDDDPRIAPMLKAFEQKFLASAERLRAAGLIESIEHESETGTGVITFTEASHELMLAGRQVFDEPGFLMAWMSGDPALVRMWIESEAAALKAASATGRDDAKPE